MVRYLHAKLGVDDRALNRTVLEAFRQRLSSLTHTPKVLELGAGLGNMVSRLADWEILQTADYTLLDNDARSLEAAAQHLMDWSAGHPATSRRLDDGTLRVGRGSTPSSVTFAHADAFEFLGRNATKGSFDVVTANAVLDLMDLKPALESIWGVLKPGGLFWFSINFDGETIFLPELPLDTSIIELYHRSMDERIRDGRPAGDSKTGRHLLTQLGTTGAQLEAAGSSDWVVFSKQGQYPGDEAYFLHHIVHTIDEALSSTPELEATEFAKWVKERHAQIERGELSYIAHQLDVFGSVPG